MKGSQLILNINIILHLLHDHLWKNLNKKLHSINIALKCVIKHKSYNISLGQTKFKLQLYETVLRYNNSIYNEVYLLFYITFVFYRFNW